MNLRGDFPGEGGFLDLKTGLNPDLDCPAAPPIWFTCIFKSLNLLLFRSGDPEDCPPTNDNKSTFLFAELISPVKFRFDVTGVLSSIARVSLGFKLTFKFLFDPAALMLNLVDLLFFKASFLTSAA